MSHADRETTRAAGLDRAEGDSVDGQRHLRPRPAAPLELGEPAATAAGRNLVELETEFAEHKSALAVLRDELDNAAQDGLSLQTVRDWLTMQEIAERLQQANRDELKKG
jgi:hypothetical protein